MEIKTLYVIEINGEKHYYGSEIDRNYAFNVLTRNGSIDSKEYEISLKDFLKNAWQTAGTMIQ